MPKTITDVLTRIPVPQKLLLDRGTAPSMSFDGLSTAEHDLAPSMLQRVLCGTADVFLADHGAVDQVRQCIAQTTNDMAISKWHALFISSFADDQACRQLATISLGVSILHTHRSPSGELLDLVWDLIRNGLIREEFSKQHVLTSLDVQGMSVVLLCKLIEDDGNMAQYCLNIWLPDERRDNDSAAIYRIPSSTQSYVLAGKAEVHVFDLKPVDDLNEGDYVECGIVRTAYHTHSAYLEMPATYRGYRVSDETRKVCDRNMSYSIPKSSFYKIKVAADAVCATVSCTTSSKEVTQSTRDTVVLKRRHKTLPIQLRALDIASPAALARLIGYVREWESLMEQANHVAERGEWEYVLKSLDRALYLYESCLPAMMRYKYLVVDWLGFAHRSLGNYELARDILESALEEMGTSSHRIGICAELGVVYGHMNRLEDAKRTFLDQYESSKQLELDQATCRAVGNLGITNYQLWLSSRNDQLLQDSINQLNERVDRARALKAAVHTAGERQYASTLEAIGLARLSLCYSAQGEFGMAIQLAQESLKITSVVQDPAVVAISRFFYGRALLCNGERTLALEQLNINKGCTCAIALSKEPSEQNCQFLRELSDAGADFSIVDDQGYTALDHAIFSGDERCVEIVLSALQQRLSGSVNTDVDSLVREAKIRKGYREIFQGGMRSILLGHNPHGLYDVRRVYADALAQDGEKNRLFDPLKYVPYTRFSTLGRFPRSSDGMTEHVTTSTRDSDVNFIIFFSYRWINPDPWATTPDDVENTQYLRSIAAVKDVLKLRPDLDVNALGIWVDFACIDQDNPMPGIAALPLAILQCDALISLVDDNYHDRAWCSVELMMVQALKKSYNLHSWFEQRGDDTIAVRGADRGWTLHRTPTDLELDPSQKKVRYEEDRERIRFLERQVKLLC